MSAVRNHQVIEYWTRGKAASNHRGSLTTDGIKLWSYRLQIGDTLEDTKIVRDHTAGGKWEYHSQTTSCHVGLARRLADVVD